MMKQRNYGVDLLRIVSMFMIVMLHFLGHGGLLSSVEEGTANYRAAWFLETIAYSGVATFASISGYVGWNPMKQEKNRALGFIQLWMQVVFYSLIISVGTYLFHKEIGVFGIVKGLFPLAMDTYWYFTAYFLLFLLMPLLNQLIQNTNNSSVWVLVLSFAAFMYFSHMLTGLFGLSVLMLCYICGGVLKKFNVAERVSKWKLGGGVSFLLVFTWLWKICLSGYSSSIGSILLRYDSPTIICIALGNVLLFSKINIPGNLKKPIGFLASGAFAGYLLNDHPYIREYVITGRLQYLSTNPWILLIIVIMSLSVVFVIAAACADKVRLQLFKMIKYQEISSWIEEKYIVMAKAVGKLLTSICRRILSDNTSEN